MAYCPNCGGYVVGEAKFCNSCGSAQPQQQSEPSYSYSQPLGAVGVQKQGVYGLGVAIASAILGYFGVIFAALVELVSLAALQVNNDDVASVCLFLGIIALAVTIPSTIMGARSIDNFRYAKRKLGRNPIGTLIVGINGLVMGALGVIFAIIAIFCSISCL
jgi:hypothetical protein